MSDELCIASARQLAAQTRQGDVPCTEVMETFLARIDRVNPQINAICTLVPDQAMEGAIAADAVPKEARGKLHGLPIAVKDLAETKGIRTTWGSPLFENHVPTYDQLFVERLKQAGAIVIGKTNTPEFGAGSQSFNPIFGASCNPYDVTKTVGGSSGGAAGALAARLVPLADGSDLGGSLRNPAAFCNVVGFRPTPGRVPTFPDRMGWNTLSTMGPMGRTVDDVALLLSVMAGPDDRCPISLEDAGDGFDVPLDRDWTGVRIAWSPDLGVCEVAPEIASICETSLTVFRDLGGTVRADCPDFSDGADIFQTLRAWMFATGFGDAYAHARDKLKDTIIWNIERGLALSAVDIGKAEVARTNLYQRMLTFFDTHDFLVVPTTQVAPFDVNTPWVTEINGVPQETYLDWMMICSIITLTGCPAISVPAGFTKDGLPVGMQIIGPPRKDLEVLQMAHAFEGATGHWRRGPDLKAA